MCSSYPLPSPMVSVYARRGDETVLEARLSVNLDSSNSRSNSSNTNAAATRIAYLPPFSKPLTISIAITFDGVLLCPENTPNLFDTLKQMMEASNIWTRLCFRRTVFSGSRDSNTTFGINLHDELFDVATINDLLLSSSEQVNLNSLCTAVVRAVDIDVHVHNTGGFKEAWILGNSIKDLNFIFFQCFLKLEEHLPLLFNYISRSTYLATKDVIPPIVASCLKSNETYMIEQRSVLAGIINSLCRCPTWIETVHLWDHSKLKREFLKEEGFSITWFYPFYDETCNHASL